MHDCGGHEPLLSLTGVRAPRQRRPPAVLAGVLQTAFNLFRVSSSHALPLYLSRHSALRHSLCFFFGGGGLQSGREEYQRQLGSRSLGGNLLKRMLARIRLQLTKQHRRQESSARSSPHIVAIATETKLLGFISLILHHHCGEFRKKKNPSSSRKVPKRDIYISAVNTAAREPGG